MSKTVLVITVKGTHDGSCKGHCWYWQNIIRVFWIQLTQVWLQLTTAGHKRSLTLHLSASSVGPHTHYFHILRIHSMLKNYYFYNNRPQALASRGYTHCEVTATGPCVDRKATLLSLNPNCCDAIDLIWKDTWKLQEKVQGTETHIS
jgi:hypothetical protein